MELFGLGIIILKDLHEHTETPKGLYRDRNILYIAGTRTFADVLDDLRIPLNDTVHSQRYRDAVPLMNGVNVVVGHSLGGAVALSPLSTFPSTSNHILSTSVRPKPL